MQPLEHAIEAFRLGHAREAEITCERRLQVAPDDAAALSLLAEIQTATGRGGRAAETLSRLIELWPDDAAVRRRLGATLLGLGRTVEAIAALGAAIRLEPGNVRAHNNLGQAWLQQGERQAAIASYQTALRLDPRYAVAHNNLGQALAADGKPDLAAASFQRAIELDPSMAIAHFNLAGVFDGRGHPTEALAAYDRALAAAPGLADAWVGRGSTLAKLDRPDAALESFDRALSLRPADSFTLICKASVLLALERAADCLAAADAALDIDADASEAHNLRAGALRRMGRRADALHALGAALALDPGHIDAWCNQATILHEMGCFEEAMASCRKALELDPTRIQSRTRLVARLIPSVPRSSEEARGARHAFNEQLQLLLSGMASGTPSAAEAVTLAKQQFFYLSYDEVSNRSLLESYRRGCAARLAALNPAGIPAPRSERVGQRLRLGFVSAHVHDHSVFNAILHGWLHCLDPERFEISLFSLGSTQDAATRSASASVEHFDGRARGVVDWARLIRDRGCDALIYPEIGMHEATLALASMQLARRQFAAWGHPETSGLPTIDGYFSAELFEPPHAQEHYSETLVCLPNLGVYCQPYKPRAQGIASDDQGIDLERWDLCGGGPVLICPGVPFKYRPQHDEILVEIARRLGRCRFVFFEHEIAELSRRLEARMTGAFVAAGLDPGQFLRSIPWQPRASFFALLRHADVYLDTIGFSGFNTMMQAMECHLPCVSYDGRFMRGRLGSGILKRLGMLPFVARSTLEYVDLTVKLAESAALRADARDAIRRAEHRLYADRDPVNALGNHLLAACSA